MSKLLIVIGVTGNQGGSVARRFLEDATYKVRGLTRDPSSPAALELLELGVEIVQADLNNVASLVTAFKGANLIFSVTNYWEPFFRPDARAAAEARGVTCREYAYDVELRQGMNVVDAAGSPDIVKGLDEMGLIASTLSCAKNCSDGKFQELYHFDAKAEVFPCYVEEKYPELARKTSCVQTGYFMRSYRLALGAYFAKLPSGTFQMSFTTAPDVPVPHLAVNEDLGSFVYGVAHMGPGKCYMAEGTTCSWTEFLGTWSKVTGRVAKYVQISDEDMAQNNPDTMFGEELANMFSYSSEPGYDGGDGTLLKAEDIRKAGFDCSMTSLEDFIKAEDWSVVLNQ
ncbi:hypothetical protein EG328_003932 [Venturia inaequalis]|uniref:NmrA-like domain-containing protein n=1 Tax=Venturia inaequalis TaxID=5025 RepID=A0A8H3URN9_VENIN|nr:hypothetical protein EG328_003932 [Venturia inaequalis]RDI86061.1 Mannan endo-1,6-alpha-mannosidase [Venturia inaequalis]